MHIEIITIGGKIVASITNEEPAITDAHSASDLIMSTKYGAGSSRVVLDKEAISDDFYDLSTGLAEVVLGKFASFYTKLAIYGDFGEGREALQQLIDSKFPGKDIYLSDTMEQAVDKLLEV